MNASKTNEPLIFRRDDPKSNVPLSSMRQTPIMVARAAEAKTVMPDDLSKIERMLDEPIVYSVRSRGHSPVRVKRRSSSSSRSKKSSSSSRSRRNKSPRSRSVVVEEDFVMPLQRTHEGRPLSRTSSEKRARRTWKKTAKKLNRIFGYAGRNKIEYSSSATSLSSSAPSSSSSKKG
jgi:hypothetical protein